MRLPVIPSPPHSDPTYEQGQQNIAWLSVVALIAAVVARFAMTSGAEGIFGPEAWPWIFIAIGAFLAAGITAGTLGLRAPSRLLGVVGRASLLMIVIRAIFDSSGQSAPSRLLALIFSGVGSLTGTFGQAIWVLGLVVLTVIAVAWAIFYFLPFVRPTVTGFATVAFGKGRFHLTRFGRTGLLPLIGSVIAGIVALVVLVATAIGQWLFYGLVLFGIGPDKQGTDARPVSGEARSQDSWASRLRESLSSRKPTGPVMTVYRDQIKVQRQDGRVIEQSNRHWKIGKNADAELVELREFAEAVVVAYDTALNKAPTRPAGGLFEIPDDDGTPAPRAAKIRYTGYSVSVSRAWTEMSQHALVVKISPPAAAEDAAKLSPARIIPIIDSHSAWSSDELEKGLNLSARLRESAYREGQTGLFITLAREDVESAEGQPAVSVFDEPGDVIAQIPDGLQERLPGIRRAISESILAGRLRLDRFIDDQEADVLEFHARQGMWHTFDKWQELVAAWNDLAPRLRHYTAVPEARLTAQVDPYALVVSFPKPPAQFPSGEAMLWRPFILQNLEALRRTPLRFPIGADRNSETVYGELSSDTPAWLIAGEPGSGKSAGVVVPMLASLFVTSKPDRLKVTLVDSTKRELLDVFGLSDDPHILRAVSSRDGTDRVLATLDAFLADMDAAYGRYAAQRRHFDPRRDAAHVLFIEELADLFALTPTSEGLKALHNRLQRAVQVGRGAGYYLVATIQLPKATLLPTEIRGLFGGRIVGYYTEAGSYRIALDEHRRFFETKIAGRMVVRGGVDRGDTFVQTYYLPPKECLRFIAEQREIYGLPPTDQPIRSGYNPLDPNAGDEPPAPRRPSPVDATPEPDGEPTSTRVRNDSDVDANSARCPTPTEIRRFDALTAWRILTRNAGPDDEVSRAIVTKWISSEGLPGTGTNQMVDALAVLTQLGLLDFHGPTKSRTMGSIAWSPGAARIMMAEDDG
jgi:hypothetical protein